MNNTQAGTPVSTTRGLAWGALISGILGLVSFVLSFASGVGIPLLIASTVLGIIALVLGILALKRRQPRALAITGIVTGVLSIVLALGILLFALVFVGAIVLDAA